MVSRRWTGVIRSGGQSHTHTHVWTVNTITLRVRPCYHHVYLRDYLSITSDEVHSNYIKIYGVVFLLPIFQPMWSADLCPSLPPYLSSQVSLSMLDIFRTVRTRVSNVPLRSFPVSFSDRDGSPPSTGLPSREYLTVSSPGPCQSASPVTHHQPVVRTFCPLHVDVLPLFVCPRSVRNVSLTSTTFLSTISLPVSRFKSTEFSRFRFSP